ncbi:MAG: glycosyltransferase [Clostridia bacterium]|nr:glycosyltransferase [Clostridia bacterium]
MNFLIQILMIIIGLGGSFYLFYNKPYLRNNKNDTPSKKKLSIIIPCRNEENNIKLLLNDLLKQTIKPHEIIVVDDNSTDNTLKVAKTFPVKVIAVKDKNAEYLGKSWAVETGSKEASGELLLFLDADVRLQKNALKSLLSLKELDENKVVTVQPYHQTEKFYEQFSLPFNLIQIAANEVCAFHGKPFALYGPLILISAVTYEKIGRHFQVRQSIIEDVSLGIVLKKEGYEFNTYLGNPEISFRMYAEGFKSLFQGWTKNIYFGALKTSFFILFLTFLFITSILGSFTGLVTSTIQGNILELSIFGLFYIIWVVRLICIAKPIGKFKTLSFIFYPVVFLMFTFIFIVSMIKKIFHIPVKWKERIIK